MTKHKQVIAKFERLTKRVGVKPGFELCLDSYSPEGTKRDTRFQLCVMDKETGGYEYCFPAHRHLKAADFIWYLEGMDEMVDALIYKKCRIKA